MLDEPLRQSGGYIGQSVPRREDRNLLLGKAVQTIFRCIIHKILKHIRLIRRRIRAGILRRITLELTVNTLLRRITDAVVSFTIGDAQKGK